MPPPKTPQTREPPIAPAGTFCEGGRFFCQSEGPQAVRKDDRHVQGNNRVNHVPTTDIDTSYE